MYSKIWIPPLNYKKTTQKENWLRRWHQEFSWKFKKNWARNQCVISIDPIRQRMRWTWPEIQTIDDWGRRKDVSQTDKKSRLTFTLEPKHWFHWTAECLGERFCKYQLLGRATDEAASFEVMRCRAASFPSNVRACKRHEKFKLFTGAQHWVMAISVDELFHLLRAKLQKNPPKRSPTVGGRARAIMALNRMVVPGHPCCRLSSFACRASTESCHVRMNSCSGRKRKVLKVKTGLLEAVLVCDLVSFLSFPRSAELQFSGVKLVWNGVACSALVSLWSLKDVFLWSYCFRKTTTASPCRYLERPFPSKPDGGVHTFSMVARHAKFDFFP